MYSHAYIAGFFAPAGADGVGVPHAPGTAG